MQLLDSKPQQQKIRDESEAALPDSISAEHLFWPKKAPLYVVAEKILSGDETLPHNWAVDGTTGYDFANAVNGIFVNESNGRAFDVVYRDFAGRDERFGDLVNNAKRW